MDTPIVLTVRQITWAIKTQLERLFPNIWVKGEVSNCKLQSSGHLYFSLIDEDAQLSAVMFRSDVIKLPLPLKNGDTIIVRGDLNVYPQRGNYQVVVRSVSYAGLGEQLIKLQELKKKIEALGWSKPERKKPLPKTIQKIAVVTSPTGAVLRDIYHVLSRRMAGFQLIVNPVRVQGDKASAEIAQAIRECSRHKLSDVIIVCRGGGSAEDLAAFNDEEIARAIVESTIPIISAVGHETDYTIADLVADVRAPTPSAAAELVSHEKIDLSEKFNLLFTSILKTQVSRLERLRYQFNKISKLKILQSIPQIIQNKAQTLDDLEEALKSSFHKRLLGKKNQIESISKYIQSLSPISKLNRHREHLIKLAQSIKTRSGQITREKAKAFLYLNAQLDRSIQSCLIRKKGQLNIERSFSTFDDLKTRNFAHYREEIRSKELQLEALNPYHILKRGYAVVRRKEEKSVVSSASALRVGEQIEVILQDGNVLAEVINIDLK